MEPRRSPSVTLVACTLRRGPAVMACTLRRGPAVMACTLRRGPAVMACRLRRGPAVMASLLLTLLFVCGVCHAGPAPLHYVPSDARPGHVVAVLPAGPGGQLYRIAPALARAHLLVTGSGELITSSRVAHLAGQTLTVHIERESAGDTPRLTLRLHVRLPSPDTHPFVGGASAPRGRPEGVARRVRRAASADGARVFVVRRTLSGALFSVGRGVLGERFMFGEVGAPHLAGLVLQPDTGLVQRSAAHRWLPDLLQLHFTVNVTRPLQPHCECTQHSRQHTVTLMSDSLLHN